MLRFIIASLIETNRNKMTQRLALFCHRARHQKRRIAELFKAFDNAAIWRKSFSGLVSFYFYLALPISLVNAAVPIELIEALPDPEGIDQGSEYIILKNTDKSEVDLSGLYLDDKKGESSPYSLGGYTIPPLGELFLSSEETGISINNTGDEIRILDNLFEEIFSVEISSSVEGAKYILTKDGYAWNYQYEDFVALPRQNYADNIAITEIMPNPEEDESSNEWIEIANIGQETINLSGLMLDDSEDGSSPYELPNIEIKPGGYTVIYRSDSKIALNNSNDSARILTPSEDVISSVQYEKTEEGMSYQLTQIINAITGEITTKWQWANPTEGVASQALYTISGSITDFSQMESTLTIEYQGNSYTFGTSELDLSDSLSAATFSNGTEVILLYQVINGQNTIIDFELENSGIEPIIEIAVSDESLYKRLLPYLTTGLAIVLLAIYETVKKQEAQ